MKPLGERSYAFVVNIWEERRDIPGAPPTWRGSVNNVQNGTRIYFSTLREVCEYLGQQSGMCDGESPSE